MMIRDSGVLFGPPIRRKHCTPTMQTTRRFQRLKLEENTLAMHVVTVQFD